MVKCRLSLNIGKMLFEFRFVRSVSRVVYIILSDDHKWILISYDLNCIFYYINGFNILKNF
jgi:hypothetical protein